MGEPICARLDAFIEFAESTKRFHDADFYRHCRERITELEMKNAQLTVSLHKAQSQLMAHRYLAGVPEGPPFFTKPKLPASISNETKPRGVDAYPKHRGENHLRKELDKYTESGSGKE